jgi:hypothetical protein
MMLCNEICFVEESVSIDSNLFISEASLHLNQNKYVNLSGGKRISTNKIWTIKKWFKKIRSKFNISTAQEAIGYSVKNK